MDIQSPGLGTTPDYRKPEEEKRSTLAEHMTQQSKPTLRESVLNQVAGGINDPAAIQPNTLPVNDRQWNLISRAASESEDPDAYLARYGAALTFSKEYGIPVDAALDNLDEFSSYLTGEPFKANKTGVQAIRDSFVAGRINMQYSDLAYKFKQADLKGEDTSAIMTQLEEYAGQIAALQDHQPRNIATTALKWTAEGALPYMIEVGKSSLMGATFAGGLATGFTAATGVTLGSLAAASPWSMAAIISMGATVGAVNRTRELMEGVAYLQLRELGIDKDIANVGSRTIGMVVGAIEAGLGIEVGTVIKAVGGEQAVTAAASKATAKLVTSGKLGAFINGIISLGVNATDEMIEEMSEEIVEYAVRHISYAWQETRGPLDPMPDENLIHDTLMAGFMGFGSALVLGLPSALFDTGMNIRQLASIRQAAQMVQSKEAFVNSLNQSRPESIEAGDWSATMANLWDREHKGKTEPSSIKSDQTAYNELDSGKGNVPTGKVRRLNSGRLYTAESENTTVDTSGREHRRLLIGDPVSGSRYGYIDYSVKGNDLVVDDVMVRSGYESVRKEALLDLLEKYPGYDVTWEAKGEALADVRQQIIDANPRGRDAGLQYRDGITNVDERLAIESQIERAMPNLSAPERTLAAILVQLRAESEGTTAQGWLDSHFKDGQLFGDSAEIGEAVQGKRGAVSFDQDLKAIIYAGENADFSTFAHETFHVMLRNMDQIEQFRQAVTEAAATPEFMTWLSEHAQIFADGQFADMDAQQLVDVAAAFAEGEWGRTQEEFSARLYEGYLADGKTASGKLKQLFNQIAKWMAQIYTTLKHSVDLDPRIIEVFDSLSDNQSPLAKQLVTQESNSGQMKSEALYQGDEGFMKAPNGKPTNLTEKQWKQVRTPEFIKWFGDWMNDPANASKVVDENGEPKVMYHGTKSDPITTFDPEANGRGIIYTTEDMAYAEDYTKDSDGNVMEVFVNMRHPADPANDNASIAIIADIHKEDTDVVLEAFTDGYDPYELLENPKIITALKENGYDGVVFYEEGQLTHGVFDSNQIKSATGNVGTFDGENPNILFQEAPPDYQPNNTGIGYKVFVQKDGKLYPPMVANPNGEGTPVGKWLLADEAPIAAYSKTGRPQVKSGGKGTQGKSGLLAYRPGWHLGEIPYAKQFNRLNPATGNKELFPKDFVWAEVEYSKDNDYNDEARQNGVSKNGGFSHALASLYRMPTDGFYNYRTNPDPTTDPWVITGAMKVNKILTREEVETIVKDAGREPQKVEGDNLLFQEDGKPQISNDYPTRPSIDPKNWDFKKTSEQMSEWKNKLREWVDKQGDILQFGDESLVHVVHKNVIPDELPWRSTTFINGEHGWVPFGHADYDTKYKAVLDNVGGKAYRPDILFQDQVIQDVIEGMEQGSLAVLHNISPEKLVAIDDIGGLPSPSLAITRPGIPFEEFGSVTLIADPAVARAALEEGRLYDRDVWSPSVPRAEWRVNRKIIESFDKKIRAIGREMKGHLYTSETFYSSSFVYGLESLLREYKNNLAAQLTFLKEHGYDYQAKYMNRDQLHYFPIEIMEAHKDFFLNNSLENDSYEAIREHLRPLLEEHFSKDVVDGQPLSAFTRKVRDGLTENALSFSSLDSVFTLAKKYDPAAVKFDEHATWLANKDAIASHDAEFTAWLKENLKDVYTDPKIKIGSKNYEYNAENILRWMRTQSETASQKTMTYGPEKAASNAGTPFSSRGDVRRAEGSLVTRDEQGAAWAERVKPLTERLQQELPQYNKKYSTWDSLDSIYKAIGKYITKYGHDKDTSKMRTELSAQGFTGVPKDLLKVAVDLAAELVTLPQDYLEAKPDRIVSLDEFKAAVVPSTLPAEQRAVLDFHGIQVIEYQSDSERTSLISDLYANERSELLFQDGPPITEAVLEDARGMESWEEFMDFYQAFSFGEEVPTDEAWYKEVFNEAHGIVVADEVAQERVEAAHRQLQDEDAKDEYMKDKLSTDEGVIDFLGKLGYMLSKRTIYDTEGDPVFRETVEELQREAESLVHPTVLANAFRVKGGTRPTQRAIKSVRTLMTGDAIRYYRDVYALVMEDLELRPQVIDDRLPAISDPGINTLDNLSIAERLRLANRIEATELKKAFLSGKETFEGAAEKIIRDLDMQIRELGEKIAEQEAAIEEGAKKFDQTERSLLWAYRDQRQAKRQLDEQIAKVRKLTDQGRRISKEELKRTHDLQAKLKLLDDQVMAMREGMKEKSKAQHQAAMDALRQKFKEKSADARAAATLKRQEAVAEQKRKSSEKAAEARLQATVARHEALDKLKGQLTEKQRQKAEAQRVRKYKLDIARRIMTKPSDAINWEQAVMIYELQAALDPAFRRESTLVDGADGQRRRVSIDDARELFSGSSREQIIDAIGLRMYEWIADERRPLNEWTVAELEDLAERVGDLRAEGRRILAAKRERQQSIARQYQESIMRSLIATGKYQDRPIVGSMEDQEEKASPFRTVKAFRYSTLPMRAKAMMLDNDTQGTAYNLLVTRKRDAQAIEWTAVELRQKPIIDFMKQLGLTEQDLYETVSVALDTHTSTRFTYSALMYIWLSQFDRDNRNAVAYGNLVTQSEKANLYEDDGMIMALGDERYRNVLDQAEYHLSQDDGRYMQVLERVRADFNGQRDRINEVAIREFNKPLRKVDEYLPIHRREFNGENMHEQIADDWFNQNAGGSPTGVTKGFTRDRIKISPNHQRPVNLDLMQVWNRSVRDQEHFIAFAEYGRELNRVFKSQGSVNLRNIISRTLGQEMVSDIHAYMNQVINPQRNIDLAGAQKAIRFMRGNLGAAYLTWKMSALVLQTITSPAPFLQEVRPLYMAKGYIELFSHPLEAIAWINEKSPMMKNRTMNVIIDEILQQSRSYQQNKVMHGVRKMQEIGGMGLTLVDRYAVAGGWLGAYHQRMDALMEQGMTSEQAERMAVAWADDITLKTQPTGDVTEIAPLFTSGGEWARAFMQFTTSLNVIWTNLTYDMPTSARAAMDKSAPADARRAQFSRVVGTIVGYGLAGAVLGAVADGYDDDDDEIDKLRKWIYWSTTQANESVPLFGHHVDSIVKTIITGDKPDFFADEFFPGMMKIFKGIGNLAQGDLVKALNNLAQGAGYMGGVPVSGIKQAIKTVKEGPGAMLGR